MGEEGGWAGNTFWLSEEMVADGIVGVSKTGAGALAGLKFSGPSFVEDAPVGSISEGLFADEAGAAVALPGTAAAAAGTGSGTEKESPGNIAAAFRVTRTGSPDASAADEAAAGTISDALTAFAGGSLLDVSAQLEIPSCCPGPSVTETSVQKFALSEFAVPGFAVIDRACSAGIELGIASSGNVALAAASGNPLSDDGVDAAGAVIGMTGDSGAPATACEEDGACGMFVLEFLAGEFVGGSLLVFCALLVGSGGLSVGSVESWAAHAAAKLNEFRVLDELEASNVAFGDVGPFDIASWMAKVTRSSPQKVMPHGCRLCANWEKPGRSDGRNESDNGIKEIRVVPMKEGK